MNPNKPTVLSIEDEEIFQQLITISLEFHGMNVVQTRDGASGLQAARSHKPDLILLDLLMPGMSGIDVCRALMADPQMRSIPVVMLSGSSDFEEIQMCLQLGAREYVLKPFEPQKLTTVVLKHLPALK
jgi:CheY-like chemotaxis protein